MMCSPLLVRHSGAGRRSEPGIHDNELGAMDSGRATSWRPGMTQDGAVAC